MLNVGRLRILKEVAYRGSFSAAADALAYPQSAVSQQLADLALLFEFEGQTPLAEEMGRSELLEDPMYLALPRGHPLADKARLRLSDLAGESWIQTSHESPCARHVVRCCHAAGFEPSVSFE